MTATTSIICRICGNGDDNRRIRVREMQFGWREEFDYHECAACGCIQIAAIPDDLARYYPADYYAHKPASVTANPRVSPLRRWRNRALLGRPVAFGSLLVRLTRPPGYFDWFTGLGLDLDSAILDVGCGTGSLLLRMRRAGFTRLSGADPFIPNDIDYGNGLKIYKAELDAAPGDQNLVMSNDSFEHMPEPLQALRSMRRLVRPDGAILIRMPVAGCHAWRKYGANWVGLDAPRHLHLHTTRSMSLLARQAGLRIERIFYDSDSQQVINSELYALDIPSTGSGAVAARMFSPRDRAQIASFARFLNAARDGDSAGFVLRPDPTHA